MVSIIEFALFAWVGISAVAVLIQLLRIARYKRATRSALSTNAQVAKPENATIDLGKQPSPEADVSAGHSSAAEVAAPQAMAGAPATKSMPRPSAPTPSSSVSAPTPEAPAAAPQAIIAAPSVPKKVPTAKPLATEPGEATPAEAVPAAQTITLADLLAGVRLPWNLLPTVDQSREPTNDRVVLITSQGEPSEIGVDVADELERLGFVIAPRGDDTAIATRGDHSLGLQIIEDPMAAELEGTRRFPNATESSVALDIWIE